MTCQEQLIARALTVTKRVAHEHRRRLTEKDRAILRTVADHVEQSGYPPTYREIAIALGKSPSTTVTYAVYRLVDLGYLTVEPQKSRTMRLTEKGKRSL